MEHISSMAWLILDQRAVLVRIIPRLGFTRAMVPINFSTILQLGLPLDVMLAELTGRSSWLHRSTINPIKGVHLMCLRARGRRVRSGRRYTTLQLSCHRSISLHGRPIKTESLFCLLVLPDNRLPIVVIPAKNTLAMNFVVKRIYQLRSTSAGVVTQDK